MVVVVASGSRQKEKLLLLRRFAPLGAVVREHRLPQYRMTTLPLPAIQIRSARQHHLDHENKRSELRARTQAGCNQIRLGDVSTSNRLERLRWPAADVTSILGLFVTVALLPVLAGVSVKGN